MASCLAVKIYCLAPLLKHIHIIFCNCRLLFFFVIPKIHQSVHQVFMLSVSISLCNCFIPWYNSFSDQNDQEYIILGMIIEHI